MEFLSLAVPPVAAPAAVALLVAFFGRGAWRSAIAIALGYVAGHRMVVGNWPPVPFGEATLSAQHWRFYLGALSLVAAPLLFAVRRGPARWLVVASFAALAARATLDARFRYKWEPLEGTGWLALASVAVLLQWLVCGRVRRQEDRATGTWWDAVLLGTGLALSLQLSRSSSNAQLAGALTACVGALAVADHLGRRTAWPPAGSAVWLWLFGTLVLEGHVFGKLPLASALVLAAHPLALALAKRMEIGASSGRGRLLVARLPALVLAAAAVGLAFWLVESPTYSYGP